MAAIVWSDVTDLASNLSSVSSGARTVILAEVNTCFNTTYFVGGEDSEKLKLCRIYYAAHLATVAAQGASGAAGPVTHEMIDRLQRSYSTPAGGIVFDGIDSTSFGKALRALLKTTKARGPLVL